MSTTTGIATKNVLIRAMVSAIPPGLKRLIMMSSLLAYLTDAGQTEQDFMRDVNKALNLSRGGDAGLEFPVRLSKVFWGNRQMFQAEINTLNNVYAMAIEKQQAAERIVAQIPSWFIYESPKRVVDDLVSFFQSRHQEHTLAY